MSKRLQAIRGMNDILPFETPAWLEIEQKLMAVANSYGYQQIRFPIVESTELFARSIGDVTDIVEKEMYTFSDRNGDSLTLRPEGTACCVRAVIEHGLAYNQVQKLYYQGPLFRHERPQRGRYRQFHQFGMEVFGIDSPQVDAELILICARIWAILGISNQVTLELNTLGSTASRASYRAVLVAYFSQHMDLLDEDAKKRLTKNPLRILDSKNPSMQPLIKQAPQIQDYIDDDSKAHFARLCEFLDSANISYRINPCLVRGLDYYNRTVFEWVTEALGAQATICAGGRYDGLVEIIGGKATPGIGFALGIERVLELIQITQQTTYQASAADVYIISYGDKPTKAAMLLAESLRNQLPHLIIINDCSNASLKAQFKRADKSQALLAIVIAEDELAKHAVTIKHLREDLPQQLVLQDELVNYLQKVITQGAPA